MSQSPHGAGRLAKCNFYYFSTTNWILASIAIFPCKIPIFLLSNNCCKSNMIWTNILEQGGKISPYIVDVHFTSLSPHEKNIKQDVKLFSTTKGFRNRHLRREMDLSVEYIKQHALLNTYSVNNLNSLFSAKLHTYTCAYNKLLWSSRRRGVGR